MADEIEAIIPTRTLSAIDTYFKKALARTYATEVQDPTGFRLSIARRRFKEGMTTEDQFISELRALRVPEDQIELEVIAGRLEYAYDYTMDLIAAYRDAVRKGNIGLDFYLDSLLSLGIVPERATGYQIRERARQKPEEALTTVAPVKPYYETDAGKVQVDTIRRQRRARKISRDEEIASFLELGMPPELAISYADNDDERLRKEGVEE